MLKGLLDFVQRLGRPIILEHAPCAAPHGPHSYRRVPQAQEAGPGGRDKPITGVPHGEDEHGDRQEHIHQAGRGQARARVKDQTPLGAISSATSS